MASLNRQQRDDLRKEVLALQERLEKIDRALRERYEETSLVAQRGIQAVEALRSLGYELETQGFRDLQEEDRKHSSGSGLSKRRQTNSASGG